MFVFNLEGGSKGEWFTFCESKMVDGKVELLEPAKDAGRVCVRIAGGEVMENIQAQTRTKKREFVKDKESRQMVGVSYIDQTPEQEKKERELIWDYAIVNWENLLDVNGKAIPCTLENKLKMMNIPMFSRFLGHCFEVINNSEAEGKAIAEKN